MYNTDPDNNCTWTPPKDNNYITINGDKILFSDDTGIAFKTQMKTMASYKLSTKLQQINF